MKTIRNIIVLILVVIGGMCLAHCQDFDKSNHISFITSPGSFEDGYSIGVQYEYQNRTVYVGPEVYLFPGLNDMDYSHLIIRVGFNKHFSRGDIKKAFRFYLGGRAGGIWRNGYSLKPMMGGEAGLDIYIPKTSFYTRVSFASDVKTDSKIWSNNDNHTVNSVLVGIGLNF